MVLFLMVLVAGKQIIIACWQLIRFKSMRKSTICRKRCPVAAWFDAYNGKMFSSSWTSHDILAKLPFCLYVWFVKM